MLTPIRRIYNRVIPDELERKGCALPFDYRDDLDVEWTGHPDVVLPHQQVLDSLAAASVGAAHVVPQRGRTSCPRDRERLLLKPLFSFAGGGIVFAPTDEQLARDSAQTSAITYILQERIAFTPVIDTPHGPTQAEIRIMFVWTDRLRAVLPLVRMGRGKMMGVDHNKGLRWVGASAALIDVRSRPLSLVPSAGRRRSRARDRRFERAPRHRASRRPAARAARAGHAADTAGCVRGARDRRPPAVRRAASTPACHQGASEATRWRSPPENVDTPVEQRADSRISVNPSSEGAREP